MAAVLPPPFPAGLLLHSLLPGERTVGEGGELRKERTSGKQWGNKGGEGREFKGIGRRESYLGGREGRATVRGRPMEGEGVSWDVLHWTSGAGGRRQEQGAGARQETRAGVGMTCTGLLGQEASQQHNYALPQSAAQVCTGPVPAEASKHSHLVYFRVQSHAAAEYSNN